MGWSIGFDDNWNRDIGYGVPAWCDLPDCPEKIDRGLAYVCGGQPYGGDHGCGLFFCERHLSGRHSLCPRCAAKQEPFAPKADHPEWVGHKLKHPSWQIWRQNHSKIVKTMRASLASGVPAVPGEPTL